MNPFTLRGQLASRPRRKAGVTTLFFTFDGDTNPYAPYQARFVGGVDDQDLTLTDNVTQIRRPVTEAELDRPLYVFSMVN